MKYACMPSGPVRVTPISSLVSSLCSFPGVCPERVRRLLVKVAALLCAAMGPALAMDNLLSNGGFENGTSNWVDYSGGYFLTTTEHHTGFTSSGRSTTSDENRGIYNSPTLPLTPNRTYRVRASVKSFGTTVSGDNLGLVGLTFYDGSYAKIQTTVTAGQNKDWTSYSTDTTAPAVINFPTAWLYVYNSNGSICNYWFDDFTMVGLPNVVTGAQLTVAKDSSNTFPTTTLTAEKALGSNLTWSISSQGAHGTAAVTAPGADTVASVTYIPTGGYLLGDSFTVQVSDGTFTDTCVIAVGQTKTWNGGGSDDNWSTALNWSDGVAPVAGDALVFAGTTRPSPNNDLPANTSFGGITFSAGATAFTLAGNAITLSGTLTNSSSSTQTVNLAAALSGAVTVTASTNPIAWNGVLSGSGSLTKAGGSSVSLGVNNSFTGGTAVSAGTVNACGTALGTGAVTVAGGATLMVAGGNGLLARYFNVSPSSANFASMTTLQGHLGSQALVQANTATTLNFGNNGGGFPAPYNSGADSMESIYSGRITIGTAGAYTFSTSSDDGSVLFIDGTLVVDNNFFQGFATRTGTISLSAGAHDLVVAFYQGGGGYGLNAQISGVGNTTMVDISTANCTLTPDLIVGSLAGAGAVVLTGGGLVSGFDGTSTAFSGVISGPGGVTKAGGGTMTLSGANTFTGTTTVAAGTLAHAAAGVIADTSAVAVASGAVWNLANFNETVGSIAGAGNITLGSAALTCGGDATSTTFSGVISGTGAVTKAGAGTMTLSGVNTYTGATAVLAGVLSLGNSTLLPSTAVAISSGAVLEYNDPSDIRQPTLTLTGAGTLRKTGAGMLTFGGNGAVTWNLGSGSLIDVQQGTLVGGSFIQDDWTNNLASLNIASGAIFNGVEANVRVDALTGSGTFSGGLNGAGYVADTIGVNNGSGAFSGVVQDYGPLSLVKAGTGAQTLSGSCTYTGTTTIGAGTLLVVGSLASNSAVSVANAATLGGTGTVAGAVSLAAGATLAPGTGGATIGTLTTGAVTTNATSIFSVDLNGSGSVADRCTSSGTFACSGTLTVASLANAAVGNTYTIASGSAVSGTFTGLANGATFVQQARTFQIVYGATTVTLVDQTGVAPSTRTWDGGGADNRWTTAANWVGNVTPLPGDALVFAGSTRLAPDDDFAQDTSFSGLTFASGAGAFTLASTSALRITLAGSVTNSGSALQTISLPMVMAATRTMNAASGDFAIADVLSGAGGLTKTGTGTLTLSVNNTFTGLVTVSAGTLATTTPNSSTGAVGAASGVLISSGGTVLAANDNAFVGGNPSGAKTIQIDAGGVLTSAAGLTNHLHALVLNGGAITAISANATWGSWNADFGISTLGGGTTSTISGGNLALTQSGGLTFTIATGDTVTVSSVIAHTTSAGDNGLIKAGAGTLTLSGVNTYTSATTINAGTLKAGVATQAFGVNTVMTLANAAGATLDITGFASTVGSLAGGGATGGTVVLGAATLTTGGLNSSTTYAGTISGTGGLTKTGSGTMTLAGTLANTNTGRTTIADGTMVLQKTAGVAAIAGDITIGDGIGADVLTLAASNQIADTSVITFTSGGAGNSAKFELNGYLETVGGIQTSGVGTAAVIQNVESSPPAGPNSPAVLTVANSADFAYDGLIRDFGGLLGLAKSGSGTLTLRCGFGAHDLTYTGATTIAAGRLLLDDLSAFNSAISNSSAATDALTFVQNTRNQTYALGLSGTGALTKTGAATLTLSGTDAATGATTVSAGTLLVTGSTAAGSAVTVAPGTTLGGSGTVAGPISVGASATLTPGTGGTTIATLATGALTMDAAATFSVDLDGTTPTSDRAASTGAVVRAGTLTIASNSNAAVGKVYTILTSTSASGTFSGLADGALTAQAGRLYRIAYTATAVTLTDCAPVVTARATIDANGDGHLDRIRLTFDQALNDDFSAFTVTVAGYTVTSCTTGSTANDASIDVLLTPLAGGDTGATPAVRITANTSLTNALGTGLIQVEGSGTAATDTAAPVLLAAAWTDGGTGGVSALDTVTLTFSETVTAASMTTADLGLPVTGDTLGTTTIANQSGTTITMTLGGTPHLTPGGAYSSSATGAGKASGVYLASASHLQDAVALAPAVGSAAGAVDLGPGTTSVAIAWNAGSDPKDWALGTLTLGTVMNSLTSGVDLTVLDVGNCTVDLTIASSVTAPSTWAPAGSAGANAYLMKADASGASGSAPTLAASYPLTLTTAAQALSSGLLSGGTKTYALYFQAPTSITSGSATVQTITVTITAALAP